MRRTLGLAILLLAVTATGCVDLEESITLQPDLSGEASVTMNADLEPMVEALANTQHLVTGSPGAASAAELEAARQQVLADRSNQPSVPSVAELEAQMPQGIHVLESHAESQGTKMSAKVRLHFASVATLGDIRLPSKGKGASAPEPGTPGDHPFAGLQVRDEGATLLVFMPPMNLHTGGGGAGAAGATGGGPDSHATGASPMTALTAGPFAALFKSVRFGFRLDTPFAVVETNATRRDGNTLVWEYGWDDLVNHRPTGPLGLYVRLRKPS